MPSGKSLFFASPKKSNQKKGDPVRRPYASLRAPCDARSSRGLKQLASLKQVSALIRLALRFSAPLQGFWGRSPKTRHKRFALVAPRFRIHSPTPWRLGRGAEMESASRGRSCLSEASSADRRRNRAPQVACSEAKGPRRRVAFSFGYFAFGEAKEK